MVATRRCYLSRILRVDRIILLQWATLSPGPSEFLVGIYSFPIIHQFDLLYPSNIVVLHAPIKSFIFALLLHPP